MEARREVEPVLQKVEMDFPSAVVCRLDSMKDAKAISNVGEYMESLFRFAEESSGLDPASRFSDRKSESLGGSALWRVAVSFLPGGLAKYAADPKRCSVKFVGL